MNYAIICDARSGEALGIDALALVDRKKSKKFWWTSDRTELVLVYQSEVAAKFACRRLRRNRARVVDAAFAMHVINEQHNRIVHHEAMNDMELGWDGHKDSF